jgi:hypothetical protein
MKKLQHPEFVAPAALAILLGVALSVANVVLDQSGYGSWGIPVFLILTGAALARRIWLGTVMLLVGVAGLVVSRGADFIRHGVDAGEWTLFGTVKTLLGIFWVVSMGAAAFAQFKYFQARSSPKTRRDRTSFSS